MKYTGLNPTDVNRVASGSLGVFVESTQVGTFGTNSLVISGSTVLSGSLINIGPQTNQGNLVVSGSTVLSGSVESIGSYTQTGLVNILGNTTITGSTILSSSLNVIGTETVTGILNTAGTLLVSGSTILSSSLQVIGSETITGSLNVSGSTQIIGALNTIGEFLVTGSAIISSSLAVIGQQSVQGVLQSIGSFFATGSAIISSSLSVIGTSIVRGTSIVSGSSIITGSLTLQGPAVITGSQYTTGTTDVTTIQGSTSDGTLLNILGTSGQLFSVTDGLSGSLFSVNTISGLPVLEAFSDFSFVAGQYGVNNLFVKDSKVGILTGTPQATLDVSGSAIIRGNTRITGSTVITGSLTIPQNGDSNLLNIGGTTAAPTLLVGTNQKVNIGTTSSVSTLNVAGTTNVLTVQGTTIEGNMFDVYGPSGQLFSVVDGLSGSLFSVNTISGVPVMEVFSNNTVNIGQYSNPPIVVSGPDILLSGSTILTGHNLTVNSGSIIINKSGSGALDPLFDVEGAQGQLFSVIDSFSGSLMSVNDISGFPILDVRSDDTITMGTFGSNALVVSQSNVIIGVTASAAPIYTGRDGEIKFGVSGSSYFMFVYLAGKWRSGSLSA